MVSMVDQNLRSKLTKDGSYLKHTRTIGGIGNGLIVAGGWIIGIGVLFAAMIALVGVVMRGLVAGGIVAAIGGIIMGMGYHLKNKRVNDYLTYYQNKSGYTHEALKAFDEEFQNGEAVLVSRSKKMDKRSLAMVGIFTKHWFRVPTALPVQYSGLYHVEDIVAIWYQGSFVKIGNVECMNDLVALDCNGKFIVPRCDAAMTEEIISELVKRNPKVLTKRKFTYEGKEYDVVLQPQEVIALYQSVA